MDKLSLDEDQRDCLQELMNISYGSATASLAEIIEKNATLGIPNIKTFDTTGFEEYCNETFNNGHYYLVNQKIDGKLSGENLFIIDKESSINLAKEFGLEDDEINDSELKDVILEVTNIISSTTLSKLASFFNTSISFSPPHIDSINTIRNFNEKFSTHYHYIIVISTQIIFEDQDIYGELIIMSKDESISFLKDSLDKVLDEF